MKRSLFVLLFSLLGMAMPQVLGQNPGEMHAPPKVLLLVREDIKPGMMTAHNKHSANYATIFAKLQTTNHRIAMIPVAGSENEVVYLTGCDSFAELETINRETDKKMSTANVSMRSDLDRLDKEASSLHVGMRDIMAVYRPELSFNPGAQIPQMRYFSVTTVRIRPGHDAQYADYVQKVLNVVRSKAKLPDSYHLAAYQVISGAPGGTYMFFRAMRSLAELDTAIGPTVRNAMSDDQKKDADKTASDAVISSETSTYSFMPAMSYLPKEFTASDAAFWTPPKMQERAKPRPVKKPATTAAAVVKK